MKPTLLVLAAGMGSRYGGVKQIDSVGLHGETLLDFATYDAMVSGYGKVVYIIRRDIEKDFRERLFDRVAKNFNAEYVFQDREALLTDEQRSASVNRKKPWGTIQAVLCAENAINEPFTVINADDYYGREAFKTMNGFLSPLSNDETKHAVVCYVLGNTMSKSGSVSRGVCTEKDGYLVSVKENTCIEYVGDKIISTLDGKKIEMTGNEWVSMNFFGFTPKAFEGFHKYWDKFISNNYSSEKAEAYLPEAAGLLESMGLGKLKFFTSTEKWFGMTYLEDRENVKHELANKIATGYYPKMLWKK
ncbi:MAG: hypothetical protein GX220_08715 [Treponema sp.]|nr:hypothetical protein [Treponema sp.]